MVILKTDSLCFDCIYSRQSPF